MLDNIISDYEIKNFSLSEITHSQTDIPAEYHKNIIPTICVLQKIRGIIDNPIIISSSYRDHDYNERVKGKLNSLHLIFNAIDFYPEGYNYFSLSKLYDAICLGKFSLTILWNGRLTKITPKVMGIGLYPSFIHIDTRGLLCRKAPARWQG